MFEPQSPYDGVRIAPDCGGWTWPIDELLAAEPLEELATWAPVDVILTELESMTPDHRMQVALEALAADRLSEGDRVRVLRLWERCAAWVAAQQQRWIVAVAGATRAGKDDWAAVEVGAALRLSPGIGAARVGVARSLETRFACTLGLLQGGHTTMLHAGVLVKETRHLDDATAREVEFAVLRHAMTTTVGRFTSLVRKAVIAADPELATRRVAIARSERSVRFFPLPDGVVRIEATLPAADALTIWHRLEAMARRAKLADPLDPRGIEAMRADALTALCSDERANDPAGSPVPRQATGPAGVLIDAATLMGLADNPGELVGYGPIPASMARELAAQTSWQLMITDAVTGRLEKIGTVRYRPTAQLAALIRARDRTCRFPGCAQPGYRCDIDHRVPFNHARPAAGGQTDEDNCQLLCERHHRLKHETCWTVEEINDAGTLRWTSPSGQTYVVETEVLGRRPDDPPDFLLPGYTPPPPRNRWQRPPPGTASRDIELLEPPF